MSATQARYRLSLRERVREFFREYVQHEGGMQALVPLNTKLPDAQERHLELTERTIPTYAGEPLEAIPHLGDMHHH